MILYLDTSSLIKLYVDETGTLEVLDLVEQASLLCTSVVAYPEARSALARLHREGELTSEALLSSPKNRTHRWTPGGGALEAEALNY